MKLYSCKTIKELIDHYIENDGWCETVEEGVLGYGELVLSGPGLKTCIVRERYLNEWSSAHSVRFYNKVPKKYEQYA